MKSITEQAHAMIQGNDYSLIYKDFMNIISNFSLMLYFEIISFTYLFYNQFPIKR